MTPTPATDHKIDRMPLMERHLGTAAPAHVTAAEVNDRIRRLMTSAHGRPLRPPEAAEYGRLLEAWAAATRAEMAKAA